MKSPIPHPATHTGTVNGEVVDGWIIRDDGQPKYLQIDGRGGLCIRIESFEGLREKATRKQVRPLLGAAL